MRRRAAVFLAVGEALGGQQKAVLRLRHEHLLLSQCAKLTKVVKDIGACVVQRAQRIVFGQMRRFCELLYAESTKNGIMLPLIRGSGHKNITHTIRYTRTAAVRFEGLLKVCGDSCLLIQETHNLASSCGFPFQRAPSRHDTPEF